MRPLKVLCSLVFVVMAICSGGYAQHAVDRIEAAAERPGNYVSLLQGKRVGVIINQTSRVGDQLLPDVLLKRGVTVTKIFVPEHGFRGNADAGAKVDNSRDETTGLPVISLYGKHKKPTAEDLADVDVLVYDLQDVGVRFYTYISTMEYCMEACAQQGKQFVVLDRPNPNGFYVDGPVLEKERRSFVGMQRVPVVYGMTPAEYAQMLKGERWFAQAAKLDLRVVKCINYDHSKLYALPVPPSPNLKTMAAVYAYPSLCFFEGTPVSVGRGTDLPFQQYGCPEFKGSFSYSFTPRSMTGASKPPYENQVCYGELVGKNDQEVLAKLNNQLTLQWLIKSYNAYPDRDKFFNPFFTTLYGVGSGAAQIRSGISEEAIRSTWQKDLKAFKKVRKRYLLYEDAKINK